MPEGTDASATDTNDTNEAETATDTAEQEQLGPEGKKALDAFKQRARTAEREAKAAQAQLQKLQEANMNEVDRALKAAKDEGLAEGTRNASVRLVDAEVRAAAAGRSVDTDALLNGLDRAKFLDDAGEPDLDAIKAFVDAIAPADQERGDGFQAPDLAQGTRTPAAGLGSDALTQSLERMVGVRR